MRTILRDQEQRQKVREMNVVSLAKFVFRYLKGNLSSNPSKQEFFYPVVSLRQALFPGGIDNKSCSDHAKLSEAITLLERRGLVVRESSYPLRSFSTEKMTSFISRLSA